jgi:hypothetical protein
LAPPGEPVIKVIECRQEAFDDALVKGVTVDIKQCSNSLLVQLLFVAIFIADLVPISSTSGSAVVDDVAVELT